MPSWAPSRAAEPPRVVDGGDIRPQLQPADLELSPLRRPLSSEPRAADFLSGVSSAPGSGGGVGINSEGGSGGRYAESLDESLRVAAESLRALPTRQQHWNHNLATGKEFPKARDTASRPPVAEAWTDESRNLSWTPREAARRARDREVERYTHGDRGVGERGRVGTTTLSGSQHFSQQPLRSNLTQSTSSYSSSRGKPTSKTPAQTPARATFNAARTPQQENFQDERELSHLLLSPLSDGASTPSLRLSAGSAQAANSRSALAVTASSWDLRGSRQGLPSGWEPRARDALGLGESKDRAVMSGRGRTPLFPFDNPGSDEERDRYQEPDVPRRASLMSTTSLLAATLLHSPPHGNP
jgi:hypothetical protein